MPTFNQLVRKGRDLYRQFSLSFSLFSVMFDT